MCSAAKVIDTGVESPQTPEPIKDTGFTNPGFHCVPVSKTDLFTRHSIYERPTKLSDFFKKIYFYFFYDL